MRILLVHNFYRQPGGEETYLASLTKLLRTKGHKVLIWSKDNREIGNSLLRKIKIAAGMFWNRITEKEFSDVIRRFKPDIAHFNNIYPLITPTAYHVCKRFEVPIVQTIHSYRFMFPKSLFFRRGETCELCLDRKFFYPAFLHKCYNESFLYTAVFSSSYLFHSLIKSLGLISFFIFPSEFTRRYYLRNSSINKGKTQVIPNPAEMVTRKVDFDEKEKYFLYAGRFSKEKGIIGLLKIFSSLPDYKLILIGDGPLRNEVLRYKHLENVVIRNFLPPNKVFDYMRKALFTIVPSEWYEVLPTVAIESFANGTPVIVPKIGGFIETVQNGKTGLFYECGNYNDLRDKIIRAKKEIKLTRKMSLLAFNDYEEKYTPEKYYPQILEIYNRLIK